MKAMKHSDTTLWMWQVWTGFALFFLASAHLYQMLVFPEAIGPAESGLRMLRLWPFYLVMLLAVEFHGGIGLYRLAVKWCIPSSVTRATLTKIKWGITIFFLALGLVTWFAYIKVGLDIAGGERYITPDLRAGYTTMVMEG